MVENSGKVILMFDMDMTLTPARTEIQQDMLDVLQKCRDKGAHIAVVSGSDYVKVVEQCTQPFVDGLEYCFSENGLYTLKQGKFFEK